MDALERWAAGQAAGILEGLFIVAAVVMLLAILPTAWLQSAAPPASAALTTSNGLMPVSPVTA